MHFWCLTECEVFPVLLGWCAHPEVVRKGASEEGMGRRNGEEKYEEWGGIERNGEEEYEEWGGMGRNGEEWGGGMGRNGEEK